MQPDSNSEVKEKILVSLARILAPSLARRYQKPGEQPRNDSSLRDANKSERSDGAGDR
jgi:hypothetical protein